MERLPRSEYVTRVIDDVRSKQISDQEYTDLICGLFNENRKREVNKIIYKYVGDHFRRSEERKEKARSRGNVKGNGAAAVGIEVQSTGLSELQPCPIQKSIPAERLPLIFRGDLVPKNGRLFMDVEKLSLKVLPNSKSHIMKAGSVAIVNENRDLVLWAYVNTDVREICQFFPRISGLSEEKIGQGIPIEMVRRLLDISLHTNILVGSDLQNDLKSIGYCHENCEDLQDYFRDSQNQPYGLKVLAGYFFNQCEFQCSVHSCISDARMTRKIHKRMIFLRDVVKTKFHWDIRTTMPRESKRINAGDHCKCTLTAKKGKKKKAATSYGPNWANFEWS